MSLRRFAILMALVFIPCMAIRSQELHNAARSGDLKQVKTLLEKDPASLNSRDTDKNTPLHCAIDAGQIKVAALLLERGADIEAVNYKTETPLHVAAGKGNADAVKLLLKNHADPKKREMRDRIPLFLACNWGNNLEAVRLLIDAGSDVNDTNTRREHMLLSTLYFGRKDIIDLLVDRGAVIPDDEETLQRVLYITASNGMERIFDIAVDKSIKKNLQWWSGLPMHVCAMGGSVSIAEALAAKGILFTERNRYGLEPLHIAAENGRKELVEWLLSKGAGIDNPNHAGKTALHLARENGHEDLAVLLISRGASQALPKFPRLEGDYLGQKPPGETPELFAPGIVSSYAFESEHSPCVFSPDLSEVYWTSKYRGPVLTMRKEGYIWTAPQTAPFYSEYGEGEPIFSPDGDRLYFLSMRPIEAGGTPGKENIWVMERNADGWSEQAPVSPRINAFDLHWLFSVAGNGTIYFASPSGSSLGQNDIYRSRLIDGEYGDPENLGSVINTPGIDHTPFIAPDESYLIYVSTGGSPNPMDMRFRITYQKADGSWTAPVDAGDKVNAVPQSLCPAVTPDGRFMFFIGAGDIHWIDAGFIEALRPNE